jgi:hypothetical protein
MDTTEDKVAEPSVLQLRDQLAHMRGVLAEEHQRVVELQRTRDMLEGEVTLRDQRIAGLEVELAAVRKSSHVTYAGAVLPARLVLQAKEAAEKVAAALPAPRPPEVVGCCFLGCNALAQFEIIQLAPPVHPSEGYTHACADHVGDLLSDAERQEVVKLQSALPTLAEVAKAADHLERYQRDIERMARLPGRFEVGDNLTTRVIFEEASSIPEGLLGDLSSASAETYSFAGGEALEFLEKVCSSEPIPPDSGVENPVESVDKSQGTRD